MYFKTRELEHIIYDEIEQVSSEKLLLGRARTIKLLVRTVFNSYNRTIGGYSLVFNIIQLPHFHGTGMFFFF